MAIAAPDSEIELPPAVAVTAPLVQLVAAPLGVDTIRPDGSISLDATPVSDTVFALGLPRVKVTVELVFNPIVTGENASAMVGAPSTSVGSSRPAALIAHSRGVGDCASGDPRWSRSAPPVAVA